jgi:hypothetical protein
MIGLRSQSMKICWVLIPLSAADTALSARELFFSRYIDRE